MKNVIYTQRVEVIESYQERRDCADQRIADFIIQCGFLPVPLPNKKEIAKDYIINLNPAGIILTGGNSLCQYGGNAPERDAMDEKLLELAIQYNVPVLGFCRGMQSIVSFFGSFLENVTGHVAIRHRIIGEFQMDEVNSYHNQACKVLTQESELKVLVQSEDGVIEAVRHKVLPILGIMWHPEREDVYRRVDIDIVKNLFE